MKDKITLSLDIQLLEHLDKEMIRHQMNNRSKFIEFVLKQVLFSPEKKLAILEKSREEILKKFKAINEDVLIYQEYINKRQEAEKLLEVEKDDKKTKDALWS